MMKLESRNLFSLKQLLETAQRNSFAVEAFSPRNTPMIRAILQAGESTRSPLIVQVAQVEFQWYQLSIEEFARQVVEDKIVHFLTSNNHAGDYPVQGNSRHA